MIELGDHSLLIFEILLILINECISLINDTPNVVENGCVCAACGFFEACQFVLECLVFALLTHQLIIHVTDLTVVFVQLADYHLIIGAAIITD